MTDKELFKILKQYKVFTKFYLACTEAWSDPKECCNPRDHLRHYLDNTAKKLMQNDASSFINAINNNWTAYKTVKLL